MNISRSGQARRRRRRRRRRPRRPAPSGDEFSFSFSKVKIHTRETTVDTSAQVRRVSVPHLRASEVTGTSSNKPARYKQTNMNKPIGGSDAHLVSSKIKT